MIYYYGLSADPITVAHIDILKTIHKRLHNDDKMIVGIVNNDEKNYKVLGSDRMAMAIELIKNKFNYDKNKILVQSQNDRTYKFLSDFVIANPEYKTKDITIVIGEDEWRSLNSGKWVNWDLLLKHFCFLVFSRIGMDKTQIVPKFNVDVEFTSFDLNKSVSSSVVREIFCRNPDCHYEDVKEYITHQTFRYIKEHKLYWQNGNNFDNELKEFLADYETKKFKNAIKKVLGELKENEKITDDAEEKIMKVVEKAYGEPSVTTDTIAYNGNQILLIRRKKNPYQNYWALPGGFFEKTDEDLPFGAARELREETTLDLEPNKFVQIKTYGHNFDPRMKIVDTAFAVRVPKNMMKKALGSDDAAEARWFDLDELPKLAFHHEQIINDWLKKRND